MTCIDCIHYLACSAKGGLFNEKDITKEMRCLFFKNKTDVVEVKHGRWLDNIKTISSVGMADINAFVGYKCSECGRTEIAKEPYCNCGAKMDGRGI